MEMKKDIDAYFEPAVRLLNKRLGGLNIIDYKINYRLRLMEVWSVRTKDAITMFGFYALLSDMYNMRFEYDHEKERVQFVLYM